MKTKISLFTLCIIVSLLILACRKSERHIDPLYEEGPALPETPYDYAASNNDHKATLGRVLFYDKELSLNNSVSCGSCHQQAHAFCDGKQFSAGLEDVLTPRNSPSVFARSGKFFWDGRANGLSNLVLAPIKNHVEMGVEDLAALCEKISKRDYYGKLFKNAFGSEAIDTNRLREALTDFVSNFNFSVNKFRMSLAKKTTLNQFEEQGRIIFFGKGRCSGCHTIGDDGTGNSGGSNNYGSAPPSSAPDHGSFNIGLEQEYHDNGVGLVTKNPDDYGKFIVPVLLNAEYTAPYMHDGRFKTLEEVVEHYNSGIHSHPNLDFRLRDLGSLNSLSESAKVNALDKNGNNKVEPSEMSAYPPAKLGLTSFEKKCLVDFLKTLSDPSVFTDPRFSDPFRK